MYGYKRKCVLLFFWDVLCESRSFSIKIWISPSLGKIGYLLLFGSSRTRTRWRRVYIVYNPWNTIGRFSHAAHANQTSKYRKWIGDKIIQRVPLRGDTCGARLVRHKKTIYLFIALQLIFFERRDTHRFSNQWAPLVFTGYNCKYCSRLVQYIFYTPKYAF